MKRPRKQVWTRSTQFSNNIGFRIDHDLFARLDEHAEKTGKSRTQIMTHALKLYLDAADRCEAEDRRATMCELRARYGSIIEI